MRLSDRAAQKVTRGVVMVGVWGRWGVHIKVRGWWWWGWCVSNLYGVVVVVVWCVNIELVVGGGGGGVVSQHFGLGGGGGTSPPPAYVSISIKMTISVENCIKLKEICSNQIFDTHNLGGLCLNIKN